MRLCPRLIEYVEHLITPVPHAVMPQCVATDGERVLVGTQGDDQ